MTRSRFGVAALGVLLLTGAWLPGRAAAQGAAAPGERLVTLRVSPTDAALRRLETETGGRVLETVPELRLVRLALPPGGGAAAAATRAAEQLPDVAAVEPNAIGRGGFAPSDPVFPIQWHLDNTGQVGIADADIDAPEGWDTTRGSPDVVVAVLDTGIDFANPQFTGRLLPGYDFVNEDDDPSADHPHGVQVTGLLAANADGQDAVGVDHAAWILPVKVLDADNRGTEMDLVQGIVWAADQGADVISMSLIDYPASSLALESALQYARDRGAVLVACAGNHGAGDADLSGPGAYPQTISVGWTDSLDLLGTTGSSASATGAALDLVAPGAYVVTVSSTATSIFSGCSAATPLVAGIASLLLSVDPTLTHDAVRDALTASAVDQIGPPAEDLPGRDDAYGWGRANLPGALALVPEPTAAAASLTALLTLLLVHEWAGWLRRSACRARKTSRDPVVGAMAVLAAGMLACAATADPARYRLADSGTHWDHVGNDAVVEDLLPRYPEFFAVILDPGDTREPDLAPLRDDLESRPVDRRNYDALNAVAIGYFELNFRAQEERGGSRYLGHSFRATHLLAVPWKAYGLVDDPALRDAILDFFEDAATSEKLRARETAGRLARVVASLEPKEQDPGRRARIRALVARIRELAPEPTAG